MSALEVWWDGRHVGQFVKDRSGTRLRYDDDAPETPVSMSLPRHGRAAAASADRWLRNLLPDNPRVLARWRSTYRTSDAFELVGQVGHDLAGAIVLLPEGSSPDAAETVAQPIGDDDLAARILSLRNDPDAWQDPATHGRVRFSLAGTQGKFTAAHVADQWFWPTATLPSTHIFKPGDARYEQLEPVEAATLALAAHAGVRAPAAAVFQALGQTSFMVERFDRDLSRDIARRLHTEDLAQALGREPGMKYGVSAAQVIELMTRVGPQAPYDFLQQLAFNTFIGNGDAHAKNYSLLLAGPVRLSPLYDAVPTQAYGRSHPELDTRLAMPIAGARRPAEVTVNHWRKLARVTGLDEERVVQIAVDVARTVTDVGEDVYRDAGVTGGLLDEVVRTQRRNAQLR